MVPISLWIVLSSLSLSDKVVMKHKWKKARVISLFVYVANAGLDQDPDVHVMIRSKPS